jgi:hypothetical protein
MAAVGGSLHEQPPGSQKPSQVADRRAGQVPRSRRPQVGEPGLRSKSRPPRSALRSSLVSPNHQERSHAPDG